jgi:hypothetical protein
MRTDFGSYALAFCVVVATLSGCNGASQAPLSPLSPLAERSAGTHVTGAAQPGIPASKDLLYISNYNSDVVDVYSYPQLNKMGTLTGFHGPDGICSDKKGDVWIVNNLGTADGEDVIEYKHGGKSPIGMLSVPGEVLISCSVDPTTGNLAVTDDETAGSFAPGSMLVFAHAKGTPKTYTVPNMGYPYFCGYDDKGNLYADGEQSSSSGFAFAWLRKGGKKFAEIKLNKGFTFPGNVRWDGKYVVVGDQQYQINSSSGNYDSAVERTTGAGGKVVSVYPLKGTGDIVGFSIQGSTLIGPDSQWKNQGNVLLWSYPSPHMPTKILKGFDGPFGTAISAAP